MSGEDSTVTVEEMAEMLGLPADSVARLVRGEVSYQEGLIDADGKLEITKEVPATSTRQP